jgi:2'-5' RNA ligase
MSATRRLFIGLSPPIELAQEVHAAALDAFTEHDVGRLRFTSAHDLHITLLFLGDVVLESIAALTGGLERGLADRRAFELVLDGTGAFPTRSRPRILWAGVRSSRGERDELADLRFAVLRAVRDAGVEFAARETEGPFRPHMTLARSRSALREKAMQSFFDLDLRGAWRADEVILFHSVGQAGPTVAGVYPGTTARYVKLQRFPLIAAP